MSWHKGINLKNRNVLLAVIFANEGLSFNEIIKKSKLSRGVVSNHLKHLIRSKMITVVKPNRVGDASAYYMTQEGVEQLDRSSLIYRTNFFAKIWWIFQGLLQDPEKTTKEYITPEFLEEYRAFIHSENRGYMPGHEVKRVYASK